MPSGGLELRVDLKEVSVFGKHIMQEDTGLLCRICRPGSRSIQHTTQGALHRCDLPNPSACYSEWVMMVTEHNALRAMVGNIDVSSLVISTTCA